MLAGNVVAASQPLAAQAGLRLMRQGGNAVDAAIAAAAALMVVEPVSSGLGADALALVWHRSRLSALNASGRSPLAGAASPSGDKIAELGWPSVTVPGAVSGWAALSERFGCVPFRLLLEPALELARDGFAVTPLISRVWRGLQPMYLKFPEVMRQYYPEGRGPEPGTVVRFPQLSRSLEAIAETCGAALYTGELARRIVDHAEATGGTLAARDLELHRADWVEPLALDYRGVTVNEMPPNSQGIAALIALGILEHFDLAQYPVDSADSIHLQIEAMKLAFAETYAHVTDPVAMRVDARELFSRDRLRLLASGISLREARIQTVAPASGGTTYVAAADESGMVVSYIQSSGPGFGSGVVIPDSGIALQSRGSAFSPDAGHPNCPAPGKRPFHTNCPALVTANGSVLMSFGLMGWSMQPQAHVQFVVRAIDHGQEPQAILDAPRWRIALAEPAILLEPALEKAAATGLAARGHRIVRTEKFLAASTPFGSHLMFGGANMVCRTGAGYFAGCDPRRDGSPAGFWRGRSDQYV